MGRTKCPGNQQTGKTAQAHLDIFFENSRRVRKINRSVEETNFVDELRPLVRTRTEMQKPRAVEGQCIGTRRPDAWDLWCSQQEELMPNHLPQVRCNIVARRPALRRPERPPTLPWDGRARKMVWPVRDEETGPVKKPKRACSTFARFDSLAFIEGTSLSVAIHGKKAAAWVDMVNGKIVDRETYIGVFTAVANIGEALLPFLPMRRIIGGLMTSIFSSSSLPAAGPAMQRMEPRQRWGLECSLSCRTPGTAFTGLNLFVVLLGGARAKNVYIKMYGIRKMGLRLHDSRQGHSYARDHSLKAKSVATNHPWLLIGITQGAFHELVKDGRSSRLTSSDFVVLNPTHWKGYFVCVCVCVRLGTRRCRLSTRALSSVMQLGPPGSLSHLVEK